MPNCIFRPHVLSLVFLLLLGVSTRKLIHSFLQKFFTYLSFKVKGLTIQKLILHQVAKKIDEVTFQCCVVDIIVPQASCPHKLSTSSYSRLRSQCVIITSASERSDNGTLQCISVSRKLNLRTPCIPMDLEP